MFVDSWRIVFDSGPPDRSAGRSGDESGEHCCERPVGALLKKYGGRRRVDARGEIWFQAHAEDEYDWQRPTASCAVE